MMTLCHHAITKPKGALNSYGRGPDQHPERGRWPAHSQLFLGRFEGAAKIAGEAIFEGNKARLGKELYNHACSPG